MATTLQHEVGAGPPPAEDAQETPLKDKFLEILLHLFVAAVIFVPLRNLGSDSWTEGQKTALAAAIAALVSLVAGYLFPAWARQVIQSGWKEMLNRPEMAAIKKTVDKLATVESGTNDLKMLIGEAKSSVDDTRKALTADASRVGSALDLLVSPSGVTLLRAIRGRIASSGEHIVRSYLNDQARLLCSGGFLFTMEGYLQYLETILLEEKSSLICLNKTLPIGWLAPISEDDRFMDKYARIAREKRNSIKRLTLVGDKGILQRQYEHALSELPTTPSDANMELVYRWFMCLLLRVLFALGKESVSEVEQFLQTLGDLGKQMRSQASEIYSDDPDRAAARFVQESRLIHPKSIELIWKYVDSARSDAALKQTWSALINSAFCTLMGDNGSHWAVRNAVAGIVTSDELRRAVDEHSEVGVFRMPDGQVLAFHSKGDLFAGVVMRLFDEPEIIEQELSRLFSKCATDGMHGDAFGMIGGS